MDKLSVLSVGIALGVTSALMSMFCALAFAIWPDATLDFFNAIMHGLDLSAVRSTAPISPVRDLYGVLGLGILGPLAGVVYASIYNVVGTGRR
ncbi:DUF5676 family membrane protein [Mesorhizobium sp. M1006]|uniref:DUF5676 family membrane protein n=1 Tax=Mesorhizobium sp. M1006 TaxID=2957048 RepID=UPI003337D3B1